MLLQTFYIESTTTVSPLFVPSTGERPRRPLGRGAAGVHTLYFVKIKCYPCGRVKEKQ